MEPLIDVHAVLRDVIAMFWEAVAEVQSAAANLGIGLLPLVLIGVAVFAAMGAAALQLAASGGSGRR